MTGATVELVGVTKSYGSHQALAGIDLTIAPGEFIALLGPSGCGKTTALRALSGLERIDTGRIVIDGDDVAEVPTNRRDIGMVFQSYSLFPHMTVLENVEFGLRMRKVGRDERRLRASEALDMVGLDKHAERFRPPALRWPAAAGRPGQGARDPATGAPARRAAERTGCQGAGVAA